MHRKEIAIDASRCDGCGLCIRACHEGALAIVDGKAALVRKDFCDGLGDCLPACPQGAISFRDRDTPGIGMVPMGDVPMAGPATQWPIQLALIHERSASLKGTIVFAADCTAFVMDGFRERFIGDAAVIIGCPKLDDRARFDKVLPIIRDNPIDRVVIVRMEVPCCSALSRIVRDAVERCGRDVSIEENVISRDGKVALG